MALLPEELASANERLWRLEFPSNDAVPLVEFQGEITVALYPLCVVYSLISSYTEGDGNDIQGYIAVSEVGRMAIGSSRSDDPLSFDIRNKSCPSTVAAHAFVTHATSGAKPSIWSFSRSRTEADTNMGK